MLVSFTMTELEKYIENFDYYEIPMLAKSILAVVIIEDIYSY